MTQQPFEPPPPSIAPAERIVRPREPVTPPTTYRMTRRFLDGARRASNSADGLPTDKARVRIEQAAALAYMADVCERIESRIGDIGKDETDAEARVPRVPNIIGESTTAESGGGDA